MRIVIVSLDAFSLFDRTTSFIFGGAELRASIFAKELAENYPLEVIVVTKDQGVSEFQSGKVKVVPHPERKGEGYWLKRKSFVGKIKYKLTKFFSFGNKKSVSGFFKSLHPDILLVLGMNAEAREVEQFSSQYGTPYIFGCASDADLSEKFYKGSLEKDSSGNTCNGNWEVIANASCVLVQSHMQEMLLKKIFRRDGFLLRNPIDLKKQPAKEKEKSSDILWVGKSSTLKQPEIFIELARQFPAMKFCMIMNNTSVEYWNKIKNTAPVNVNIIESVSANEIESYFEQTKIFVNTSSIEGFPNTFLQAAKYGKPVISLTVDPDGIFENLHCGICCKGDKTMLATALQNLMTDEREYTKLSDAAFVYVSEKHDQTKIVALLYEQIRTIVT